MKNLTYLAIFAITLLSSGCASVRPSQGERKIASVSDETFHCEVTQSDSLVTKGKLLKAFDVPFINSDKGIYTTHNNDVKFETDELEIFVRFGVSEDDYGYFDASKKDQLVKSLQINTKVKKSYKSIYNDDTYKYPADLPESNSFADAPLDAKVLRLRAGVPYTWSGGNAYESGEIFINVDCKQN